MERTRSTYLEGIYRLAEQWPYLRYLGLGAWWAWIWLCYNATGLFALWPEGSFAGRVGLMYLFSTPAAMVALLAAALLWRKVVPLLARTRYVVGTSLLAVAGTLLIALSPLVGGSVAFTVGGVLTGMGTSVLALKTGSTYGSLGGREVLTAGMVSLVVAASLYFMGTGLPAVWQPVFIAAMPLVSALLYEMPGEDPFPADELLMARSHGRKVPGLRSYLRLVAAAALVAATAAFGRGIASVSLVDADYAQAGAVSMFCVALVALCACVMVNIGDIVRSVRRLYALLIVLGVAVSCSWGFGVDLVYLGVGKELLWMTFTCLMAYMCFKFGFPPVRAFGLGQAAYLAASAAAWWVGMACAPYFVSGTARLAGMVATVCVIVVVFVLLFTDADLKFIFTYRAGEQSSKFRTGDASNEGGQPGNPVSAAVSEEDGATPFPYGELDARIAALPERLGVSAREGQIMALFAQGHSANWIAENLVISKNTVRSHIRSIYTKLDVHSRRELLDFLATVDLGRGPSPR